jgi:hypothetical protein
MEDNVVIINYPFAEACLIETADLPYLNPQGRHFEYVW